MAGLTSTTPGRFRLLSLVSVGVIALIGVTAWAAADSLTDDTDRIETSTGPVLVAVQDVVASLAEADAAATAVHLSGVDEDRAQLRLYEDALDRATRQVEEVARLIGDDDEAHQSLKAVSAQLVRYAGDIESARLANQEQLSDADTALVAAQTLVRDEMAPEVAAITERTQDRLDDDIGSATVVVIIALVVAVAGLAVLAFAQWYLFQHTNRVLNLPLVLATLLVLGGGAWLAASYLSQQRDLDQARDGGYDSIALTADIQGVAFEYKSNESLALITGSGPVASEAQSELAAELAAIDIDDVLYDQARQGGAAGAGLLVDANRSADSTREQAATAELLLRWQRYRDASRDIEGAVEAGDTSAAASLAIGPGSQAFNGFNTAVESVLSDNRDQFISGVADASDRLRGLRLLAVALPVLAAAAALWGFQLRIGEYR